MLVYKGRSLGGIRIENNIRKEACDWMDDHNPFLPDPDGVGSDGFWGAVARVVNTNISNSIARNQAAAQGAVEVVTAR